MLALIDGDPLLYQCGSMTNDEGHPLSWNLVRMRVDERIDKIVKGAEADDFKLYLTGSDNFRIGEATILPYKGNRSGKEKPHHHARIKEYFLEEATYKDKVVLCDNWEADDGVAMEQYQDFKTQEGWYQMYIEDDPLEEELIGGMSEFYTYRAGTIICTIDKDLLMVPGHHLQWKSTKKDGLTFSKKYVTEEEGLKFFFTQLLTGDMTDNILGLYKVGPVNAKKLLDGLTEPLELYTKVYQEYYSRFGNHWKMFMHENARLLWMLQDPEDDVRHMLENYHYKMVEKQKEEDDF